jgi:hypothetical protein
VAAAMAELTEPAANKNNIVTPAFSPEETQTVHGHLNQMNANGILPLTFVVTDIEPAPDNLAGATVATTGSSADPSGRALVDYPRHRNARSGQLLEHRQPPPQHLCPAGGALRLLPANNAKVRA